MHMLATAQLGDHLATLCQVAELDPVPGPATSHFVLTFTDLPTGRTATMKIDGEHNAVMLFAAWLAADAQRDDAAVAYADLATWRKSNPNLNWIMP